ncbi:MAG: hypothetical protein ACOYB8_07480 [Eubacteriaceae bacterium]|jgi:hypothetical protein
MQLNEILNVQDLSAETYLLDKTFVISHERAFYNSVRSKYKVLSENAVTKFTAKYASLKDINDLIDGAPQIFIESIDDVLNEILQDIISVGIYEIDKNKIIELAYQGKYFDDFSNYYSKVLNSCNSIYQDLNITKENRNQNLQNAGNWTVATIGGTLFDAWTNQLEVDSMNLTETLAVAGVNAILNSASEYAANNKLEGIFESPTVKNGFTESVYESCFSLHKLLIDFMESLSGQKQLPGAVSEEDKQRARAMFNNFSTLKLDVDKQQDFINRIFTLDPYEPDYYSYMICHYGDQDQSISDLAKFFTVNTDGIKKDLLSQFVQEHSGTTEEDAAKCKQDLISYGKYLGLQSVYGTEAMGNIMARQKKLDLEFRTVDGIEFETRDDASHAREELKGITQFMQDIKPPLKDATLSYERNLLEQRAALDAAYQTAVKKKYLEQIDQLDEQFDKQFRNISLFKTAETREEAAREKAYHFVKTQNLLTLEDITTAYSNLENEFLPEVGITLEEAEKATAYLEQIKSEIEQGVPQEGLENKKISILGDQSINQLADKAKSQLADKAKKGFKGLFKK